MFLPSSFINAAVEYNFGHFEYNFGNFEYSCGNFEYNLEKSHIFIFISCLIPTFDFL